MLLLDPELVGKSPTATLQRFRIGKVRTSRRGKVLIDVCSSKVIAKLVKCKNNKLVKSYPR